MADWKRGCYNGKGKKSKPYLVCTFTISSVGIIYTGLAGAVLSILGLLLLLSQKARDK